MVTAVEKQNDWNCYYLSITDNRAFKFNTSFCTFCLVSWKKKTNQQNLADGILFISWSTKNDFILGGIGMDMSETSNILKQLAHQKPGK